MKESLRRWEESLRGLGLSPKWTPTQMQALSGQTGSLMRLHERLNELQTDLEQARREQSIFGERLGDLLGEVAVDPTGLPPSERLTKLREAIDGQNELRIRRERMLEEAEKTRRQIHEVDHAEKRLQRRYRGDDHECGHDRSCRSVKATRTMARAEQIARTVAVVAARNQRDVSRQTNAGCCRGGIGTPGGQAAGDRLKQGQQRVAQSRSRLKELQYRQGEIDEQIRQLAADKQFGRGQLQMGILHLQMERGIQKWKTVSAMAGMLKTVYKKYEKERQPDTLKEASQYLAQMTSGKYTRIWTPLAEDVLLVDDAEERSPRGNARRGTREQLP